MLILDANTLLVINDNNYPGGGARALGVADSTEFLRITLDKPLAITAAVLEPGTYAPMLAGHACIGAVARRRGTGARREKCHLAEELPVQMGQ